MALATPIDEHKEDVAPVSFDRRVCSDMDGSGRPVEPRGQNSSEMDGTGRWVELHGQAQGVRELDHTRPPTELQASEPYYEMGLRGARMSDDGE